MRDTDLAKNKLAWLAFSTRISPSEKSENGGGCQTRGVKLRAVFIFITYSNDVGEVYIDFRVKLRPGCFLPLNFVARVRSVLR